MLFIVHLWRIDMLQNSVSSTSSTTNNNLNSAAGVTLKVAAGSTSSVSTSQNVTKPSSSFGDTLASTSLGSTTTKSTDSAAFPGPIQPRTTQSSEYVFDPLCVVGIVPESNTFLQAIRRWFGKPLSTAETQSLDSAPLASPTPSKAPALESASAGSQIMSSINQQLNYLGSGSQISPPTQEITTTSVDAAVRKDVVPGAPLSELFDQYLAGISGYSSEKALSDLANAVSNGAKVTK